MTTKYVGLTTNFSTIRLRLSKAGIVCALYALSELQNGDPLDLRTSVDGPTVNKRAKVVLAGVVDEESGAQSTLGLAYLLSDHFNLVNCYVNNEAQT